ncbi:LLM class flavin-dependent oxidoreductase [Humitalea sp. 24SJ18S-53]|uniref:LLM class flavin-dependent oxidoreductase n=1 Tax=Humitalea sp. 24SJ18S-53 TaxID=3422307 RepID=UPI003D668A0A
MPHHGLRFGVFLAPFHRVGDNPTLALARDLDLIGWLDSLGYDEAWIGEHHSAGWETIAAPEIMIGAAAERTKHIRLGSGVTSLPYHHPFLVAQRFVQLDHMTRGRAMLGAGPGALVSDAYMMGIKPGDQRRRMDESLTAIMALLRGDEPVTMKTDWFELNQARLHLSPWSDPHFPIAVASSTTPTGALAAGKHGVGLIALGAGLPGGPQALGQQWRMAEAEAAKHGKTIDRTNWRLVVNLHVAEDDATAMRQVRFGERLETNAYFSETLGRPPSRAENPLADGLAAGSTLVGSPETVAQGIERLLTFTDGGCGAVLFRSHEWADREETWRSYELFARWVMPRFQKSLTAPQASRDWASENRGTIFAPSIAAMKQAFVDAGQDAPEFSRMQLHTGDAPVPER